jgi:uncharacterized membrane protein YpjA
MAAGKHLSRAVQAVKWPEHVAAFCEDAPLVERFEAAGLRIAIWSKQFENIEGKANPAICFVREMQTAGHLAVTATALACYKLAASGLRTVVETALYYSYFRSHPTELATLLRDDKWYISKQEVIDYHMTHTPGFGDLQKKFPLAAIVNPWYSRMSAIIHGQIPGAWHSQSSISQIAPNQQLMAEVAKELEDCVQIVDRLFFTTVGRELWEYFSPSAKKNLLHGLAGDFKTALALDSA